MKKLAVVLVVLSLFVGGFFYLKLHSEDKTGEGFTDELKRTVKISGEVNRIVSLAPSITEMLFSIGVGNKVVGVTTSSDYPEEAKKIPSVGSFSSPNVELIANLKPDLVIATADGNPEQAIRKLEEMDIPTYVINPHDFQGILTSIRNIGTVLNISEASERVVGAMEGIKNHIADQVATLLHPKILFQLSAKPITSASKNTFIQSLIELAGAINIASESAVNYPNLNRETILVKRPDIIIVAADESQFKTIQNDWEAFPTIPAVQNKAIYRINPDIILRPGPRVVEGLVELYKNFHFNSKI